MYKSVLFFKSSLQISAMELEQIFLKSILPNYIQNHNVSLKNVMTDEYDMF